MIIWKGANGAWVRKIFEKISQKESAPDIVWEVFYYQIS